MRLAGFRHLPARQRGVAAVEFAILSIVRFLFIFGTTEVARVLYLWNTMTQVTSSAARAAALSNFSSTSDKEQVRRKAMFLTGPGQKLILGGGIDDTNLIIEYLKADARNPVSPIPACPAQNIVNCLNNPSGNSCIRFVRVRLCAPSDDAGCAHVRYAPMLSLPGMAALNIDIPWFTAIAPVETMGTPGTCS
jgi:hypothetical protein